VVNYMDGKNYLLYQMDENFFYRSRIRDGQEVDGYKAPHKSDKKAPHTFRVRVSGNEVTHEIQEGGSWTVLDKYNEPGNNLATGKFGFYTPGGDEVGLANFNHLPDLKVR